MHLVYDHQQWAHGRTQSDQREYGGNLSRKLEKNFMEVETQTRCFQIRIFD